jgi:hypothetical protein
VGNNDKDASQHSTEHASYSAATLNYGNDPIREVFDCASWTPIASPDSESVLRALERRLHRILPRTFRELFALANGPALLGQFSNSDIPIPPPQLAEPLERWPGYDALADQLLPFMIEGQGVCVWAVRLDAGDDPPVVCGSRFGNAAALAAVRGSLQLLAEMPSSGLQSLAIVLVLRPSRSPEPGSSVPVVPLLRGGPANIWLARQDELPVLQCPIAPPSLGWR